VRVLLVPNRANAAALSAAAELAAWLSTQGFEPILTVADAQAADLAGFGVAPADIGAPALTVALGGDGTILKAVHVLGDVEAPVLGVNLGRLGFLSGTSVEKMREAIGTALAGDARTERRATLRVEVVMEGRSVGSYRALNEVFVGRGSSGRVVSLEVGVNGRRLLGFSGDGVVVATPTGSTAYALSAGGPIVSPTVRGLLIVPVSPHTLAARSLVVGTSDRVQIALPDPARADACLSLDGDLVPCRQRIERVTVAQDEHDVLLVKLDGRDFFDVVAEEFFGC